MRISILGLILLFLVACASKEEPPAAPLFDGLGSYRTEVTIDSDLARRYFDQGLLFVHGFNHDEAVRSFEAALSHDPKCAMAWWGIGFSLGPNINMPLMEEAVSERAYAAAMKAKALSVNATPLEKALIDALTHRYPAKGLGDRAALDRGYADEMRKVWQRFPESADAGALFADAMLNLNPWKQWTLDGRPTQGTLEIVATLEQALANSPDHPLANHLYIHTMEGSPTPEKALVSAERLPKIAPGIGHLVHMPGHIYIWTGDYGKVIDSNRRAVEIDRAYFKRVGPQGIYEFYHAHDHHFLAYGAMFCGDKATAIKAGRDLVTDMPMSLRKALPEFTEGFLAVIWHVMIRFGMWEELLQEPLPEAKLPVLEAQWHYARGVAFANTDRSAEARAEAVAFERSAALVSKETRIGQSPAIDVMNIARLMLKGEMEFRAGNHDVAFAAFRSAIELEDRLPYDEPRGWMQPVRHALGALLLEAGRAHEAEAVYRKDLTIHRENGWSLHGLAECLEQLGRSEEAASVRERFVKAWARSDTPIKASCFCREMQGM